MQGFKVYRVDTTTNPLPASGRRGFYSPYLLTSPAGNSSGPLRPVARAKREESVALSARIGSLGRDATCRLTVNTRTGLLRLA
ncbi:hypothetical protein P1X16_30340 [Hymenobacter sp. YC55]|nr:hypothetical protein [Hymenobacter sp. YC55]